MVWIYVLVAVLVVSAISLVGIFTFSIKKEKLENFLIYFVSFSVGTLLGDAFIHLIPEGYADGDKLSVSLSVLGGIVIMFVVEKFICWRHCHKLASDKHPHVFSGMILVGDGIHNFIDGMIIAGSFLVSIPVGIATTLAVIFHEIPQEIGNFGSLVYGGFSRKKALFLNFITALTAILGAVFVLAVNINFNVTNILIPFAAGVFIYIASSDLIPELHKNSDLKKSAWQLATIVAGVGFMVALLFLE